MISFVKPVAGAIERVVHYSILLRDIRVTLLQLRMTMLMVRTLNISSLSFNELKDLEEKLLYNILEIQKSSKLLLKPMLEGIDFGHDKLDHWFVAMGDVKCNYCKLEEVIAYKGNMPIMFGRKFILLLDDYDDPTLGKFYGGELIPFEKAIHFMDDIPERKDRTKGLYDAIMNNFQVATRYRQSKLTP